MASAPTPDLRGPKEKKTDDEIKAANLAAANREALNAARAVADAPATVKTAEGTTAGAQTRGPNGAALQGSSTERGELIGMRSGVPIYATPESLYGKARPADTPLPKPQASSGSAPTRFAAPREAQGPVRSAETAEEQRAAYQAREAPKAAAAMAPKFFGPPQATQDPTAAALTRASGVKTAPPRGPASQRERIGSMLDDPNNAYSNAAMARTNAAEQKGINDAAIRAGTASQEVRDTNPALVMKIGADTQAMSGLRYKGEEPVSRRVVARWPATAEEMRTGKPSATVAEQNIATPAATKVKRNVRKLLGRK